MAAGTYSYPTMPAIEQGTYYPLRFTVPYDATGKTYRAAIRDKFGPKGTILGVAVCTIESASAETSTILCEWYAPITADIPHTLDADGVLQGRWHYDVEEVPAAGENYARRLFQGTVAVSPEATTVGTVGA